MTVTLEEGELRGVSYRFLGQVGGTWKSLYRLYPPSTWGADGHVEPERDGLWETLQAFRGPWTEEVLIPADVPEGEYRISLGGRGEPFVEITIQRGEAHQA